jgi:hypothetical protein
MATSASQTYIAKLGFQDRDRSNQRHGLACEYLFERMLELEVAPRWLEARRAQLHAEIIWCEKAASGNHMGWHISEQERIAFGRGIPQIQSKLENLSFDQALTLARSKITVGQCVNIPISSRSYVNGFADVLIKYEIAHPVTVRDTQRLWLGEVKITKEPAENVLQQINFYLNYLENVEPVYILTDYDPGDLKRLCAGTKIKVYRLGQVFEQWLANRTTPATEEL